jgi:hypothetical protein
MICLFLTLLPPPVPSQSHLASKLCTVHLKKEKEQFNEKNLEYINGKKGRYIHHDHQEWQHLYTPKPSIVKFLSSR